MGISSGWKDDLRIDQLRRDQLRSENGTRENQTLFYLTGLSKILLDRNVKESLAGRCHTFVLHGLSVREIYAAFPDLALKTIFYRGALPELYTRERLRVYTYLNDYNSN